MQHQDWNIITFTGPSGKPKKADKAVQDAQRKGLSIKTIRRPTGNQNHAPVVNVKKLADENDIIPVAELRIEFRIAMQRARASLDIDQKELARRINEKPSIISEYESGRAIPNPQVIAKIERALNCRLPRPPKERRRQLVNL